MWQFPGQGRPTFAEKFGPGQESVWDFPLPPETRPCDGTVEVIDIGSNRRPTGD